MGPFQLGIFYESMATPSSPPCVTIPTRGRAGSSPPGHAQHFGCCSPPAPIAPSQHSSAAQGFLSLPAKPCRAPLLRVPLTAAEQLGCSCAALTPLLLIKRTEPSQRSPLFSSGKGCPHPPVLRGTGSELRAAAEQSIPYAPHPRAVHSSGTHLPPSSRGCCSSPACSCRGLAAALSSSPPLRKQQQQQQRDSSAPPGPGASHPR